MRYLHKTLLPVSVAACFGVALISGCAQSPANRSQLHPEATASASFVVNPVSTTVDYSVNGATLSAAPASLAPVTSPQTVYSSLASQLKGWASDGDSTPELSFGLYTDPVLGGKLDQAGNQISPGVYRDMPSWVVRVPNVILSAGISVQKVTSSPFVGTVYYIVRDSDDTVQVQFTSSQ